MEREHECVEFKTVSSLTDGYYNKICILYIARLA